MKNKIEVWYLYHSGVAVKINNKLLLFDYYKDKTHHCGTSLSNGIFVPSAHRDTQVFVFVSHRHSDHYNPVIFNWERQISSIRYILSSDIAMRKKQDNVLIVEAEKSYTLSDLRIETLASTDEGVAFLVQTDGVTIYHAGDLHWWHWVGEPDPWNPNMEKEYKQQIGKLKNTLVDIAFLPVDPRQEGFSTLGISWFLQQVQCSHVFPIHFAKDFSIMEKIKSTPELHPFLSRIHLVSRSGQHFFIE